MAKKKSKEFLLAEIAFAAGRDSMYDTDYEVRTGAERALAEWKRQVAEPSPLDRARAAWTAAGRPKEGVFFRDAWYLFSSDGSWLQKESTMKNFGL